MKLKVFSLLMFFVFSLISYGQKKTVTGKVTDGDQAPVKGASITVDQQNTGKRTNAEGVYKIKIDPSSKVIGVFTTDGRMAEQPYTGGNEVNFSIPVRFTGADKPDPATGPDEQVNIGYGTVNKKNVTSSVSKVEEKKNPTNYKDIYELLKTKPGVQVRGTTVVVVGGPNTFSAGTDPLFVVDGAYVSSIDFIQPQNVKSIEILKGSSASIYGSRGANGVILITTKK